jgi:hypothetical protein
MSTPGPTDVAPQGTLACTGPSPRALPARFVPTAPFLTTSPGCSIPNRPRSPGVALMGFLRLSGFPDPWGPPRLRSELPLLVLAFRNRSRLPGSASSDTPVRSARVAEPRPPSRSPERRSAPRMLLCRPPGVCPADRRTRRRDERGTTSPPKWSGRPATSNPPKQAPAGTVAPDVVTTEVVTEAARVDRHRPHPVSRPRGLEPLSGFLPDLLPTASGGATARASLSWDLASSRFGVTSGNKPRRHVAPGLSPGSLQASLRGIETDRSAPSQSQLVNERCAPSEPVLIS